MSASPREAPKSLDEVGIIENEKTDSALRSPRMHDSGQVNGNANKEPKTQQDGQHDLYPRLRTVEDVRNLKKSLQATVNDWMMNSETSTLQGLNAEFEDLFRCLLWYHRIPLIEKRLNLHTFETGGVAEADLRAGGKVDLDDWLNGVEAHLRRYTEILKLRKEFRELDETNSMADAHLSRLAVSSTAERRLPTLHKDDAQRSASLKEKREAAFLHEYKRRHEELDKGRQFKEGMTKYSKVATRLGLALFGGFILIVPMVIMDLHPTQLTCLLTTSIFTIVVAVILALVVRLEPRDIVGATAGYAGVLIVFVGTSTYTVGLARGEIAGITAGVVVGLFILILSLAWIRTATWRNVQPPDVYIDEYIIPGTGFSV